MGCATCAISPNSVLCTVSPQRKIDKICPELTPTTLQHLPVLSLELVPASLSRPLSPPYYLVIDTVYLLPISQLPRSAIRLYYATLQQDVDTATITLSEVSIALTASHGQRPIAPNRSSHWVIVDGRT